MKTNNNILVLDFDGVICDSVNECMLSSYNAYLKIKGLSRIKNLSEIGLQKKKEFFRLRPFVREGKDYVLFFWIMENKITIKNQEEFNKIREQQKHNLSLYEEEFYKERKSLLDHNKEKWLSLNPLYIGKFSKEKNDFTNIFILTTKKKEYVIEILDYHKINFPKDNIVFTKAQDKIKNLLSLIKKKDLLPNKCLFIEDQIEFLVEAKKFGLRVFLVDWGYASEEQKERARKISIPIMAIKELERLLKEFN